MALQSCGVSMYDDFFEFRQGAAQRLEKLLSENYEGNRSNYSAHSSNNPFGSLTMSSNTALKYFLSLLGLKREQPGLPQHEMGILPGDLNSEGITLHFRTQSGFFYATTKEYTPASLPN
jgi:hypothetical protein